MSRDGVLALLKPPGCSSHDVVALARRRLGTAAGHLGTLDPLAAGVLVLALGRATRLIRYAAAADKEYFAEIALGLRSPSDDLGTPPERGADASRLSRADVDAALSGLRGTHPQRPPGYSARQLHGERAYRAARAGRALPLPERPATLAEATVLDLRPGPVCLLRLRLTVSEGFYVRSLARDLGLALGTGGLLRVLVRTRAGAFDLAAARTLEDEWRPLPAETLVGHLPCAEFPAEAARRLCQGQTLAAEGALPGSYRARSLGRLFAVVAAEGGIWRPKTVLGMED